MKNASMREGTSKEAWRSILRSARISASGFLVSSTEPASARYSRERDNARRISVEMPQVIRMTAMAIRMAMRAPLEPSRRSRSPLVPPGSVELEPQVSSRLG